MTIPIEERIRNHYMTQLNRRLVTGESTDDLVNDPPRQRLRWWSPQTFLGLWLLLTTLSVIGIFIGMMFFGVK